jgi:hypothetical protein
MANYVVTIQGLPELRQAFKDYGKLSEPIFQRAIAASQAILAKHTTKETVPWKTGYLTQTFAVEIGRLFARWFPTANYALFVHEGTVPHIIQAVKKKALANKETGQIFGRVVHHPGTKANQFIPRIVKAAQPEIDRLFLQALDLINADIIKATNIR